MGKGSKKFRSTNTRKKRMSMRKNELKTLSNQEVTQAIINMLGEPGPPDMNVIRVFPSKSPIEDYPDFLRNSVMKSKDKDTKDESTEASRKITIFKDTTLDFPVLCLKILVIPDPSVKDDVARFAKMFARSMCRAATSLDDADLVVFGGGSDVDPLLYGETRHETTYPSAKRDEKDIDVYIECLDKGIPMFGVCRGAQFLHVMNGGKLFQDVDGHYGEHGMHDLKKRNKIEKVSSVHHQACRPNREGGMEILATSAQSMHRALNDEKKESGIYPDIEAFYYRDTCCIGVQGHPEYEGYHYFTKWCLDLLLDLVSENPDLEWQGHNLRMKKDFVKERESVREKKLTLTVPTGKKEK